MNPNKNVGSGKRGKIEKFPIIGQFENMEGWLLKGRKSNEKRKSKKKKEYLVKEQCFFVLLKQGIVKEEQVILYLEISFTTL